MEFSGGAFGGDAFGIETPGTPDNSMTWLEE